MATINKYARERKQVSYNGGLTYENVYPIEYRAGRLLERDSGDCNPERFRWYVLPNEFFCEGLTKREKEIYQVSKYGGEWQNVEPEKTRKGKVLEEKSIDCGYEGDWVESDTEFVCIDEGTGTSDEWIVVDGYICMDEKDMKQE